MSRSAELARSASALVDLGTLRHRTIGARHAGHFVLDPEFFAFETTECGLVRQRPVQLVVDLLLEKGMLVTEAFDVILRGHPSAILRLESLTTVTI